MRLSRLAAIASVSLAARCLADGCPGDLNGDGDIGSTDLGIVLAFWAQPPELFPAADVNGDGAIGTEDLVELIARWGDCPPPCPEGLAWLPDFEANRPEPWGFGVYALKPFDDGRGPALFVGGNFRIAGTIAARYIARWDGTGWSSVGGGFNGPVRALEVFDDGSGPALFAGGSFTAADGLPANGIAKWNGTAWVSLAERPNESKIVTSMTVHDDGRGASLFVSGSFESAGGVAVLNVARWDGTSWHDVGGGIPGTIQTLHIHDDGNGAALYAGGSFSTAGGTAARHVARWDGSAWHALGEGPNPSGWGLASIQGPNGPELLVGGLDSDKHCNLSLWNGVEWTIFGGCNSYCSQCQNPTSGCWSIVSVFAPDSRSFPEVVIGGGSCGCIGWDDGDFVDLSGGTGLPPETPWPPPPYPIVFSWAEFDDGRGTKLYAAGAFSVAGGQPVGGIAAWDGTQWSDLAGGVRSDGSGGLGPTYPSSSCNDFAVLEDGSGQTLFAGGSFLSAGGLKALRIAKWDGASWTPLGGGTDAPVRALAIFDDGSGPSLHAGGQFTVAGEGQANRVARWNGETWSPLGAGVNGTVYELVTFDDGSGRGLYAGGSFTTADSHAANRIARWNGSAWTPLDAGLDGPVFCMTPFDDGSRTALYAGGAFVRAGSVDASRVARWDGDTWTPLGSGMDDAVTTVAVFDDGTGPALYAGGLFTRAGGASANRIARWDGTAWAPLGEGMDGPVWKIAVFDDGSVRALYAAGAFTSAGGIPANRIARWDGKSWTTLGEGTNDLIRALEVFDDGTGPALYAGGPFTGAGDQISWLVAKWGCDPDSHLTGGREGNPNGSPVRPIPWPEQVPSLPSAWEPDLEVDRTVGR